MLQALWLFFIAQLVAAFILERRVRSPFLFIWPIIFLFVGLPIGLEIFGILDTQSDQLIAYGLMYGIIFNFCYLAGFCITVLKTQSIGVSSESVSLFRNKQQFQLFVLLVSVLILVLLLVNGVTLSKIIASSWRDKADMGFVSVMIVWLLSLLAGCLCYAIDKKYKSLALLILLVFFIVLAFYRSRGILANFFIAGAVFWILHRQGKVFPLIAASVCAILFAVFIRSVRFLGSFSNLTSSEELMSLFSEHVSLMFVRGDLSVYKVYLSVVEKCGYQLDCFNYTYVESVGRLFGLVDGASPRVEYALYNQLVQDGIGGSLHPTAYGVIYADFSWVGGAAFFVLIGVFHALIRVVFRGERMLLLLGFVGSYTVFFARGSIYNSLSALVIGIVLTYMFSFVFRVKLRGFRNA